jgi:hypothetical protein
MTSQYNSLALLLETNNPAVVYASLIIAIYYFIDDFVVGIVFFF